jgi:hypothetical protein
VGTTFLSYQLVVLHLSYFPLGFVPILQACSNVYLVHYIFCFLPILLFTFVWPCIVTDFLIIKPTRCTNFSNLFWNENLHVSDSSSVRHQQLFTVHSAMVYVIQTAFEQQDQLLLLLESCLQTCMTYTTAECTVNNSWRWTEELSETCRFSFQNKFEKLIHLVGFIRRKPILLFSFLCISCLFTVEFLISRLVSSLCGHCSSVSSFVLP